MHRIHLGLMTLLLLASPAAAQVPADTLPADTIPRESTAPRTAFLRSLLVPGWGQFSIGAEKRGLFWAALQGGSWYMLVKTLNKLSDAQDKEDGQIRVATDSLNILMAEDTAAARRLADAFTFDDAVGQHPGVARARNLVEARTTQRQDWITYTVFFTFASAVDAYVAAQLAGFPGDVSATPGTDGSLSLRVQLPLGFGRRP